MSAAIREHARAFGEPLATIRENLEDAKRATYRLWAVAELELGEPEDAHQLAEARGDAAAAMLSFAAIDEALNAAEAALSRAYEAEGESTGTPVSGASAVPPAPKKPRPAKRGVRT